MHPLQIVNQVEIKAPASSVWDALTNPAMTKQYMFGCETISDWEKGDTPNSDAQGLGNTVCKERKNYHHNNASHPYARHQPKVLSP